MVLGWTGPEHRAGTSPLWDLLLVAHSVPASCKSRRLLLEPLCVCRSQRERSAPRVREDGVAGLLTLGRVRGTGTQPVQGCLPAEGGWGSPLAWALSRSLLVDAVEGAGRRGAGKAAWLAGQPAGPAARGGETALGLTRVAGDSAAS